jgi:hypothetical protein
MMNINDCLEIDVLEIRPTSLIVVCTDSFGMLTITVLKLDSRRVLIAVTEHQSNSTEEPIL